MYTRSLTTWDRVEQWTFHHIEQTCLMSGRAQPGKETYIRHRAEGAYREPDDGTMLGETLLRSFREMA